MKLVRAWYKNQVGLRTINKVAEVYFCNYLTIIYITIIYIDIYM